MAQVQITVTAELRDPEELFEDTQPSEVPEGAKTEQILLMVLNGIEKPWRILPHVRRFDYADANS